MACDCLKVALCDQLVHQKTLHAHVKCCMYKRKVLRADAFVCVITGNRSSQFLLKRGFQSNFVLKIY